VGRPRAAVVLRRLPGAGPGVGRGRRSVQRAPRARRGLVQPRAGGGGPDWLRAERVPTSDGRRWADGRGWPSCGGRWACASSSSSTRRAPEVRSGRARV